MCQTDDKHLSVPSNAHLFYGLAVPAFLCSLPVVPHCKEIHSVGLFPHVHNTLFQVPFYTVTRLSASHQVGEPSSSPIYVVTTANRHFFLSVSGRSVWAAKLWPRISALQVRAQAFRWKISTLLRGSIFHEKFV